MDAAAAAGLVAMAKLAAPFLVIRVGWAELAGLAALVGLAELAATAFPCWQERLQTTLLSAAVTVE